MTQAEARRSTRLRFGNPTVWRERLREIDLMMFPQTVVQDLRFGARMLLRHAGFTAVAVLALAAGIGINTAAFTAYRAFFDRKLDAHDPARMVNLALILHTGAFAATFSYPDYEAYRDHLRSFSGVLAVSYPEDLTLSAPRGVVLDRGGEGGSLIGKLGLLPANLDKHETAMTLMVSENYFSVLGVTALRGRTFEQATAGQFAASPSVLISENYWQKRFGGDPAILGKTVRLNGAAFTIIGITPHNFAGTFVEAPDFWLPLSLEPLVHPGGNWLRNREQSCCELRARLAPGATLREAQAETSLLADHLRSLHDARSDLAQPVHVLVWPGSPFPLPMQETPGFRLSILFVIVAVGMVLVVACANVAGLQLARATSRQNELSMRLSLGASRARLVRQLLTESALLGLLAGIFGFFFSWAALQAGVVAVANAFPEEWGTFIFRVNPDLTIFAFVFAISVLAGIAFGLAPAFESSGCAVSSALKANATTSPMRGRRLRGFLIATQVAVSAVLVIAGSMFTHSAIRLLSMEPGYDVTHVLNLNLHFPEGTESTREHKAAVVRDLRTRITALPGVLDVTSARAPDDENFRIAAVSLNAKKLSPENSKTFLYYTWIQPNYFQTLGIPLLLGHDFPVQSGQPEHSVILSESAAQQLWPGQNPLGRTLRLDTDRQFHTETEPLPDGPLWRVIAIARDTRGIVFDGSDSAQIYLPLSSADLQQYPILVRTRSDPAQLLPSIAPAIAAVDPNLIAMSYTLEEMLRMTPPFLASSLAAAVASTTGLLGLLLAAVGIYGTVSYIVVLRTREVGIRMALGAKKRDVLSLILGESTRPILAGLCAGMVLAAGAAWLLRHVLYGVHIIDAVSFAGVSLLFLAIGLLAALIPSRRAMRIEPIAALRCE